MVSATPHDQHIYAIYTGTLNFHHKWRGGVANITFDQLGKIYADSLRSKL